MRLIQVLQTIEGYNKGKKSKLRGWGLKGRERGGGALRVP